MKLRTFTDGWSHFWNAFDNDPKAVFGFVAGIAVLRAIAEVLVSLLAKVLK